MSQSVGLLAALVSRVKDTALIPTLIQSREQTVVSVFKVNKHAVHKVMLVILNFNRPKCRGSCRFEFVVSYISNLSY